MKQLKRRLAEIALLGAASGLWGCSDANVDLQRQITVLRDELERVKKEKAAQAPQPEEKKEQKPAAHPGADLQTVKSNYESTGRALRADLEKRLSDTQLESFTLYQPKMDPYPHKSEFSMEFRSGGSRFSLDHIPVKATAEGAWAFPSADSILAQVEKIKSSAAAERPQASVSAGARSASRAGQPDPREVSAPAASSKTVVVGWESRGGPAQSQPQNQNSPAGAPVKVVPASSPAGQSAHPTNSPTPSSVMPAQREVQIKF